MAPGRYAVLALVCILAVASAATAQDADVLVRLDAADPIGRATVLELALRGLDATATTTATGTPVGNAREASIEALALGARVTVWLEHDTEGRVVTVRVVRAGDEEEGASPLELDAVRAEPRLAALVIGALVEEVLARPYRARVVQSAPPMTTTEPTLEISEPRPSPLPRAYGTLSVGVWGRFDPVFGGGLDLRGGAGVEWPDGLRLGAHARLLPGSDIAVVSDQLVGRFATRVVVGAELVGRFAVPGHALIAGASVAAGPAEQVRAEANAWDALVVIGAIVGFAFPVGSLGAEMGVQLGLDLLAEPTRGVAVSPSLALRWDFR